MGFLAHAYLLEKYIPNHSSFYQSRSLCVMELIFSIIQLILFTSASALTCNIVVLCVFPWIALASGAVSVLFCDRQWWQGYHYICTWQCEILSILDPFEAVDKVSPITFSWVLGEKTYPMFLLKWCLRIQILYSACTSPLEVRFCCIFTFM